MTCAACSARVEKVTSAIAGVSGVEVNLLTGKMTVEAENPSISAEIERAVQDAGYGIASAGKRLRVEKPVESSLAQVKTRILLSAAFLVVLMYFTMGHMAGLPLPQWYHHNAMTAALLQFFLTLPVVYLNRPTWTP